MENDVVVVENNEAVVQTKKSMKLTTAEMTTIGLMIAVLLVMSFTPLGYFHTLGLDISLMMIPVGIGAMIIGPKAGLLLGFVFGATSFYQALTGASAFSAMMMNINPFYTFLVCIPTRMLMGWLTGMIFLGVKKIDRTNTVCYFIGGFFAAFLNTVFFMGMLLLCFWNTDFIQEINATLGNLNPLLFVAAFVGVNGLLEMPSSCIVGGFISKALSKAIHKRR
ncbi:ECF transporter S component [Anaerotignum lactatifermentans]|nr:ECF transporter S component [Anaerotignum lactatifermentans]